MSSRKTFELLGTSERAILDILWRNGPSSTRQIQRQHPVAYTTIITTLRVLLEKGFVTRLREDRLPHFFAAVPRAVLLHAAFEQQMAELGGQRQPRALLRASLVGVDIGLDTWPAAPGMGGYVELWYERHDAGDYQPFWRLPGAPPVPVPPTPRPGEVSI
jgi:predicted transcriptional regulator